MRKFFKSLLLLLTADLFTATGWAVAPIAMWGDFTTNKSGAYSFVPNGNVSNGVITVDGKPSRVESGLTWNPRDTASSAALVIAMKVSNLKKVETGHQTLISVNDNNRFGLTLNSDGNFYALYNNDNNTKGDNEKRKDNNSATSKACPEDSASKTYIVVFKYSEGGTYAWLHDVEANTTVECVTDTGCKDGIWVGTRFCLGASYGPVAPANGLQIYNVAIWNKDIEKDEAIGTIKALGSGVNALGVVSSTSKWSEVTWDPTPTDIGSSATLTVEGDVKLTMDKSVTLQKLSIVEDEDAGTQDKLTIAKTDPNKLTALTTTINADTTVEAGAASLGVVTIAGGKTLTVGNGYFSNSTNISNGSKLSGSGAIALNLGANNALTLSGNGAGTFSGNVNVLSGNLTITGEGNSGFLTGRTVNVMNGATLTIADDNATGHTTNNPANSILHVQQGGEVNFTSRNSFKSTLKLTGGTVTLTDGQKVNGVYHKYGNYVRVLDWMAGGSYFQAKALEGATLENPTVSEINANENMSISLRSDLGLDVEKNAKIIVNAPISNDGTRSITKSGEGIWEQTSPIAGGGKLTINAGTLKLTGQNTATGTLTVSNGTLDLASKWDGDVDVYGSIVGAGAITGKLKLQNGAILDVSQGALTVTSEVWVMNGNANTATVKLPTKYAVGTPIVSCSNASTVANDLSNKMPTGYKCVVDGNVVKLAIKFEATVPAGGSLTFNDVFEGGTFVSGIPLTINFGDKGDDEAQPGTFTFNNKDAASFAQIIVKGTNGGTITKAEGAGAVSASATTIAEGCSVTLPANTAVLGAVAIESGATIAVADTTTITSATGAGTIETSVYPTTGISNWTAVVSIAGLMDSENWTGTLKINKGGTLAQEVELAQDALRLDLLGNVNSTIEIAEGTKLVGYFGLTKTSQPYETWTATANMVINGTLHSNNGFSAGSGYNYPLLTTFSGALTGSGTIKITNDGPWDCVNFTGGISAFEGAMIVDAAKRSIVIGTGSAEVGKIVIAGSAKLNAKWSAKNGFVINLPAGQTLDLNGQNVTLSELNSAGTIIDTAETKGSITVQGGAINVTGTCSASVTVDLSTYYNPTSFVMPEDTTLATINTLPYAYLIYDEANKEIRHDSFADDVKLGDELIWLPVGDSITEGEPLMGHEGQSDGGYRYQLWKLMETLGQQTRTVGFRNGHNGRDKGNCGVDHAQDRWGWHAALYGGDITGGSSGAQLFNVESALETAGYPDVITILIGINDLSRNGATTADTFSAWAELVSRYAQLRPNSKILAATLLPTSSANNSCGAKVAEFNEMVRDAKENNAVPFNQLNQPNVMLVDLPTLTGWGDAYSAETIGSNFKDGLHPNETGSIKVAAAFQSVIREAMATIANDPLTIVHAHNAADGTLTVRLNKAVKSVANLTATITGTNFANETEKVSLSGGTLDENNKRVITFALNKNLVNGDYTVSVNGTVNGEALASALTATGATVEILGTGAAQNVKSAFLKGFKHRKTYTLAGTNDNVDDTHTVADGADAEGEISKPVKVGYYMELQRAGQPAQFIWVSMDAFADAEKNLGIPTVATGYHKTKVSNLDVFANRGNFLKEVTGGTGVIEFTPWSWTDAKESLNDWPEEQGNYTGWNDKLEKIAGTLKGCMQVARIREESTGESKYDPKAEMLFAYNNYNCATMTDVGIGSFATHRTNVGGDAKVTYDWTDFSSETGYTKYQPDAYTVRKIELWVAPELVKETTVNVGQYTTWSAAKKGLNLADEMVSLTINFTAAGQVFTFDETVTIDAVTVQGAAGTIAKLGEGTVTVAATTVDANVTVNAGVATLGAVTINENATIKVVDAATITSAKGAGTLHLLGVANEAHGAQCIVQGLADSTNWNGHVILESTPAVDLLLSNYGNAQSKITLRNITGYLDYAVGNGQNSWPNVITVAADVCIEGTNTFNNGYSDQVYCYTGKLIGNGVILHTAEGGATHYFEGDVSGFNGSMKTEVNGGKFIFGNHNAEIIVNDGQIIIAKDVTIAQDATWKAVNGIVVENNATLTVGGNGTGDDAIKPFVDKTVVTVNGELKITQGLCYAKLTGSGTISVTGDATIGIAAEETDGSADGVVTQSGILDFSGELNVASGKTLKLINWSGVWQSTNAAPYTLSGCSVVIDGTLDLTKPGTDKACGPVSLSITNDKTLSGKGTLIIPEGSTLRYESSEASIFNGCITGVDTNEDGKADQFGDLNVYFTEEASDLTLLGTIEVGTLTVNRAENKDSGKTGFKLGGTLTIKTALIHKNGAHMTGDGTIKIKAGAMVKPQVTSGNFALNVDLEAGAIIDTCHPTETAYAWAPLLAVNFPETGSVIVRVDANKAFLSIPLMPMSAERLNSLFVFQDAQGESWNMNSVYVVQKVSGIEDRKRILALQHVPFALSMDAKAGFAQVYFDAFFGTNYYGKTYTLVNPDVAECFSGYTFDSTKSDYDNENTIVLGYAFGISDVRVINDKVAVAVMITDNGGYWRRDTPIPASLRAGTNIHLSTDGGTTWPKDSLKLLDDVSLQAAGLTEEDGIYWFWAGDLPTIVEGTTSTTHHYKVKAVNTPPQPEESSDVQ